ncbi:MAG: UDP-N-acetyl-D-mannosamine dehydrogenase [Thermoproteota archaeon]|nr:UDP-N-acetyl-D-mannosamine dehydrogenase [Thermoproteota archaeon]
MKVSIVGSGVVGQATGIGLSLNGHKVLFHDIDRDKLRCLREKGYTTAEDVAEAVNNTEVLFVCVPTPTIDEKIELKYVLDSAKKIGSALKGNKKFVVVTFRSTIPPETTRTKLLPLLEYNSGLKAGVNFGVCMNPEFLREKTPLDDFLNPSRIIIGEFEEKSGDILEKLYSRFRCRIIRTSLETAEMIKYTSNLFLAAKISFFNEIYMVCKELNIDSKVVSEAVSLDPRIGKYGIEGGRPFGGMCLPKDLAAFIEFADLKGLNPILLKAVEEVNQEISFYHSIKPEPRIRSKEV